MAAFWALVRALRKVFGPDTPLQLFKCDWEMAFRQTPKHPCHKQFTYEIWWNYKTQKVEALEIGGQPFGGKSAQFNFVQEPAAMVAIGRSFLGLLVSHYSDDTWAVEPATLAEQSLALWTELHTIVGWRLDPEKQYGPEGFGRLLGADI